MGALACASIIAFLAARVGVALGVAQYPGGLFLGAAHGLGRDALPVRDPVGERRGGAGEGDEEVEDVLEGLGGHGCLRHGRLSTAGAGLERARIGPVVPCGEVVEPAKAGGTAV